MRLLVRTLCAIAGSVMLMAFLGTGTGSAKDPLVGMTYADAAAKIGEWKAEPVISTVIGGILATDDCIVTNWQRAGFLDSSGKKRGGTILVNLNCNDKVASAGKPGNSVATAEGKAVKAVRDRAKFFNDNPDWCEKNDRNMSICATFCSRNEGLCTVDYS
ncbi:hypothetical protein [Mycolicibacterium wolinskyi]|uniref:hypothetical protein n=1 Tax=Mycolicibacterium wolinskyi TaxID=59750 RepID=UPI00082F33FC|nr:hypothetical protein [Mycolicibacterium wolinskyi]